MGLPASVPLVSVIVPCFKQAQFLIECYGSLREQAMSNWEMILVNDGSPDETVAVGRSLMAQDDRVRLLDRENGGPSLAQCRDADKPRKVHSVSGCR